MLAELRSYGVGMIIADQSPRKVSTDVVALTDMKVAFRIVEAMDRQILSDSMGLNETQSARMARLKPGEAYLFFNRLDAAEEILTPNYRLENNIDISLSDSSIASLSTPAAQPTKSCWPRRPWSQTVLTQYLPRPITPS